jgi:competence protein ComEC
VDKAWEYTSISMAAQLATFPLGLLYFHQFPVYFLISNYLVIPLSFLALYAGLALLAFGWIPMAGDFIGYLLDKMIWLMNTVVYSIERLPLALIDGIYISQGQMLLIYVFIIFILAFFYLKRLKYLSAAFLAVFLFSSFNLIDIAKQKKNRSITVYNIRGHTAIALMNGRQATLLMDSALFNAPSKITYHIQGHLTMNRIEVIDKHSMNNPDSDITYVKYPGGIIILWQGKRILIADKKNSHDLKIPVDIAILSNDAFKNIMEARDYIDSEKIFFDSSNRKQKAVFTCLEI